MQDGGDAPKGINRILLLEHDSLANYVLYPSGAHVPRVGRGGRGRLELLLGRRRVERRGRRIGGEEQMCGNIPSAVGPFFATTPNVTHNRVSRGSRMKYLNKSKKTPPTSRANLFCDCDDDDRGSKSPIPPPCLKRPQNEVHTGLD